jgi:hypothetical protein
MLPWTARKNPVSLCTYGGSITLKTDSKKVREGEENDNTCLLLKYSENWPYVIII